MFRIKEWYIDQQYRLRKWLKEWLFVDGVISALIRLQQEQTRDIKEIQALVFKGQTVIVGDIHFNKGANSFIIIASQRDAGYVKIIPCHCTNLRQLKLWARDLEERFGVGFEDQIYDVPLRGMHDWKDLIGR